jgi:DNA mismatch repair ATPase MutS
LQEAGLIRNKKEYIDLTTQKSGSIFTTRTLRDLKDEYSTLQEDYEKAQRLLVKEVVDIACERSNHFENRASADMLSYLCPGSRAGR